MSETVRGTSGNDKLETSAEIRRIMGHRGDDYLDGSKFGGGLYGGIGDDTLLGGGNGRVQSHLYGGMGKDELHLNISDISAPFGDHAFGGMGEDRFIFHVNPGDTARITGRIDDFDISRDEIWINDTRLDFENLPANVRVVSYDDQPWLLIDERALYALEGARQFDGILRGTPGGAGAPAGDYLPNDNGEERHFIDWPAEWANGVPTSADIPYTDFYTFFPKDLVRTSEGQMYTHPFSSGADLIYGGDAAERLVGDDGKDTLYGGGGGDLIHGGEQDDLIYGGDGDDSLSGGLDNDTLYGGAGHDILFGGSGQDLLFGGDGNDLLRGNNGNDTLYGEAGNDTLYGGWGDDQLFGGQGDDLLYATLPEGYPDLPNGGKNQLWGGEGNDTLYAAENGQTTMTGGEGQDKFVVAPNAQILLTDFRPGEDYLDLNGLSLGEGDIRAQLEAQIRASEGSTTDLSLLLGGMTSVTFQNLAQVELDALIASMGQKGPIEPPMLPEREPDDEDEDENWQDQQRPFENEDDAKGDSTCFVATACYGDIWHPDVAWLRGYRDNVLNRSRPGRAFIAFYWRVGPWLARGVRSRGASGWMLRKALGGLVRLGRQSWPEWPQKR